MRDLNAVLDECLEEFASIGIPYGKINGIEINNRAMGRWGQCKKDSTGFWININKYLVDDRCELINLKETVMHEVLHTAPGCFNHSSYEWKANCSKIYSKLGYRITTTGNSEQILSGSLLEEYRNERKGKKKDGRYELCCPNHGVLATFKSRCKKVQHPEYCYCKRCGKRLYLNEK